MTLKDNRNKIMASGAKRHTLHHTPIGHTGSVWACAFSPDGVCIVTASDDKTARVWDSASGAELAVLTGHTDAVRACTFSPDGAYIVTASDDKTVRVWDAATRVEVAVLIGHTDGVRACVFSSDGHWVLSGSMDKTFKLWDLVQGACIRTFEGHTGTVNCVAITPDKRYALSGSADRTLKLWDIKTGTVLHTLRGHTEEVNAATFSPDSTRIVSASSDKKLKLWDIRQGAVLHTFAGHTGEVLSANFSPDGTQIVSASRDETFMMYDVQTGKALNTLRGHTGTVQFAVFSLDGTRIVTASEDRTARVWDAASGDELAVLTGHTSSVWKEKPKMCADSNSEPRLIHAFNAEIGSPETEISGADTVDFSVIAPQKVICAQMFLLQVFLHTPEEAETARALAVEFDPTAKRLGTSQLEVDLLPGSVIMVELFLPGMEIDEPVQRLIWKSRTTSIQFGVSVPPAAKPGPLLGRITLHLDGIPVGSLRFKLDIVSEGIGTTQLTPQRLECEGQRYRQAFISYSSKDRKEVIKRVHLLERFHIHFFQDILHLEPGMRWKQELYKHIDTCDVFLLFWSSASKASPWVDKEVRYALARKENSGTDSPEIIPILIEGPPVPFPPEHLSHLHFNDRMLYFMQDS